MFRTCIAFFILQLFYSILNVEVTSYLPINQIRFAIADDKLEQREYQQHPLILVLNLSTVKIRYSLFERNIHLGICSQRKVQVLPPSFNPEYYPDKNPNSIELVSVTQAYDQKQSISPLFKYCSYKSISVDRKGKSTYCYFNLESDASKPYLCRIEGSYPIQISLIINQDELNNLLISANLVLTGRNQLKCDLGTKCNPQKIFIFDVSGSSRSQPNIYGAFINLRKRYLEELKKIKTNPLRFEISGDQIEETMLNYAEPNLKTKYPFSTVMKIVSSEVLVNYLVTKRFGELYLFTTTQNWQAQKMRMLEHLEQYKDYVTFKIFYYSQGEVKCKLFKSSIELECN